MSGPRHAKRDSDGIVTQEANATEETAHAEETAEDEPVDGAEQRIGADKPGTRRISWARVLVNGALPGLALVLALGTCYLKWVDSNARDAQVACSQSVSAASDSTVAVMSYRADTVEKDLGAAVHNRLTGHFKDSYNALTHELVIPEARRQHISSVANVPAAACVSATADHAVVLVFVDQIVTVGQDHPTSAASRVRVTLDKIGGAWLISDFTPL